MMKKQFIFEKSRPFFWIDFFAEYEEATYQLFGLSLFLY